MYEKDDNLIEERAHQYVSDAPPDAINIHVGLKKKTVKRAFVGS